MIDFANIESNNKNEEEEAKRWGTCVSVGGEKGERWSICVDATPLYLLFFLLYNFASTSALEEEDEAGEVFALSITRRKEEEEASEVERYDIIHAYAII